MKFLFKATCIDSSTIERFSVPSHIMLRAYTTFHIGLIHDLMIRDRMIAHTEVLRPEIATINSACRDQNATELKKTLDVVAVNGLSAYYFTELRCDGLTVTPCGILEVASGQLSIGMIVGTTTSDSIVDTLERLWQERRVVYRQSNWFPLLESLRNSIG